MLPIQELEASGSIAPFSIGLLSAVKVPISPPPINPTQLGMAIGNAMRVSQASAREQLALARVPLAFSARSSLTEAVAAALAQRGLPVAAVDDPMVASAVREDELNGLPSDIDAALDVQIRAAGYYPAKLGLVPFLDLRVRVLSRKTPAVVLEKFSYEVNHGDAKGDPRFFSAPPEQSSRTRALSGRTPRRFASAWIGYSVRSPSRWETTYSASSTSSLESAETRPARAHLDAHGKVNSVSVESAPLRSTTRDLTVAPEVAARV